MMDFMRPESVLDLANIRSALIRMEDTILFDLIERAQFFRSRKVYEAGVFESLDQLPFLEWMLRQTERMHSQLRRYECPDENPFYPDALVEPVLPHIPYPDVLARYHREINVNDIILKQYIEEIVPSISANDGEQFENYGSCTLSDVQALQAISRRIHFGKFVAEAKFLENKELVSELIRNKDVEGLTELITKPEVERQVLERVEKKAEQYNLDPQTSLRWSQKTQGKLNPAVVVDIYKHCIIPLTKKVEIEYLLRRLETEVAP